MGGTLTISIEIELGWGVHDLRGQAHLSSDGEAERTYLRKLLRKTEQCDVPVSFDVIGHLLLEECDGDHDGPYPSNWFDADPGTDVETNPLFYAPDVVRQVQRSEVDHELCTHSFSHILCKDAPDELVDVDLRRARDLHEEIGESFESFVPPRHQQVDNEVLSRNGIRTVRKSKSLTDRTLLHRFKVLTVGPHPEWEPQVADGVLETYCTSFSSLTARSLPGGQRESAHPAFRGLPVKVRQRAHRCYLERSTHRAIESGTPLHLWCHLYDLCNDHQWQVLSEYFDYLSEIPEDRLRIETMDQLSESYLDDRPSHEAELEAPTLS